MYVAARRFTVVEGMLGFHTAGDARHLRRARLPRPARGAAPPLEGAARLLASRLHDRPGADELDRREHDSERFIRPQRRYADIVVSFLPGDARGPGAPRREADACATRSPTRTSAGVDGEADEDGIRSRERQGASSSRSRADRPERAEEIEEVIWERMHFASHLRTERLGEFTIGTELHRSESLAIVQLLILYHLVTARAAIALGAAETRFDRLRAAGPRAIRSP